MGPPVVAEVGQAVEAVTAVMDGLHLVAGPGVARVRQVPRLNQRVRPRAKERQRVHDRRPHTRDHEAEMEAVVVMVVGTEVAVETVEHPEATAENQAISNRQDLAVTSHPGVTHDAPQQGEDPLITLEEEAMMAVMMMGAQETGMTSEVMLVMISGMDCVR